MKKAFQMVPISGHSHPGRTVPLKEGRHCRRWPVTSPQHPPPPPPPAPPTPAPHPRGGGGLSHPGKTVPLKEGRHCWWPVTYEVTEWGGGRGFFCHCTNESGLCSPPSPPPPSTPATSFCFQCALSENDLFISRNTKICLASTSRNLFETKIG